MIFEKYTQGTLTISGGIGLYSPHYPLAHIAKETGELESAAKSADASKNKVALFEENQVYSWKTLREKVIEGKLRKIQQFFSNNDERGRAMLYKLLEYPEFDSNEVHQTSKCNI
jgi:CRISPR-associated protein Csm1